MKDSEGFNIRCIYSDWKIVDAQDNHDFVCTRYFEGGTHYCFCDDYCKDYKPDIKAEDTNELGDKEKRLYDLAEKLYVQIGTERRIYDRDTRFLSEKP